MNGNPLRMFVENRAEELMANGIFADHVRDGRLVVRMCWTSSSAISFAELILLREAATPTSVILNCTSDPEELRTPIERILSRAGSKERWHVALAIPDMTTWLLAEPKFAESETEARAKGSPATKADVAVRFKEWAQQPGNHFNRDEVSRKNEEFEALNRFVEQHLSAPASA